MKDENKEKEFKTPTPEEQGTDSMPESQQEQINPSDYVYPPNAEVTINTNLWNLISQAMSAVSQQEIPLEYEIPNDLAPQHQHKTLIQLADEGLVKPRRNRATNLGMLADSVLMLMREVHFNNITKGVAVHRSILEEQAQKPKMDVGYKKETPSDTPKAEGNSEPKPEE